MSVDQEDIVPEELIRQALALSDLNQKYFVYFEEETGNILSVSNEYVNNSKNVVEFDLSDVSDFLNGFKNINRYRISLSNQNKPVIVSKLSDDKIIPNALVEIPLVKDWKSVFMVENHLYYKQWVFQVQPDYKSILQPFNLDYTINMFIVDKKSDNSLIRQIPIKMKNLTLNEKFIVPHEHRVESSPEKIKVYMKRFFTSSGLIIL
jgi:hypothetical protein